MPGSRLKDDRIVVVIKRTKWERDVARYGSARTARKLYKRQNDAYDKVRSSHERQMEHIAYVKKELPDARFIFREALPFMEARELDLLVSLGGDNHFVHTSHFADGRPVMGVNSDDLTSTGALLYFNPQAAVTEIQRLLGSPNWQVELNLESWTRISGELKYPDGRRVRVPPCVSEITVRSRFHDFISRYLITIDNEPLEEQKSSGLLLANGVGSTGWYRSCHPTEMQKDIVFAKDAEFFRAVAREPGYRLRKQARYLYPEVRRGQTLQIISEMDGEITIDADPERILDYPPGCLANFRLHDNPLKVVSPPANTR